MPIRVVIADDQGLIRAGFRAILESQADIEVVAEAADGTEAVAVAQRLEPDVVLMDIRMPGMDGIEATRRLAARAGDGRPRVLILTTFDLDDHVYAALRAGASGFLLKDVSRDDLLAAVRVVARGDALLAPAITRRLLTEFAARPVAGSGWHEGVEGLTPRELEVLELIARGLSNAEIAATLSVSDHTVKTHVANLLAKLALRDRVHAVILAYETGLVRPESA